MSVSGVNNSNNNAGTYAAGAAVVGGGAAGAYGYFSRPFLKDGAPTDAFIKKISEKLKDGMSSETRGLAEAMEKEQKVLAEALDGAKTVAEYKSTFVNHLLKDLDPGNLDMYKEIQQSVCENFEQFGFKASPGVLEEISAAQTIDDLKRILGNVLDKEFDGKSLETIKDLAKSQAKEFERQVGKGVFNEYWDAGKKAFVDCNDDIGKAVKSAAQNIQLKTAGIYGGIAAAVLGLGTYLCCAGKKAPQVAPEQNIDAQA